jgi:hypothetical protein
MRLVEVRCAKNRCRPASPPLLIAFYKMASAPPNESTPQRLAAIREQLKLLADYL